MKISFLRSRDFLWYWMPPLVWCGIVICLSGELGASKNTFGILKWLSSWFPPLSMDQFNLIHFYFRKIVGHAGNYGFLYFLWFRAFRRQLGCRQGRAFLYSLTLCPGLALTDEGHQALLASRTGAIRDVALDMGGSSLSSLITLVFRIPRVRLPALCFISLVLLQVLSFPYQEKPQFLDAS